MYLRDTLAVLDQKRKSLWVFVRMYVYVMWLM